MRTPPTDGQALSFGMPIDMTHNFYNVKIDKYC